MRERRVGTVLKKINGTYAPPPPAGALVAM